ncbi:hypothetical protein, partial [Alkalihalobacillus alcalophilus]|uniref:hypothetical protein n=1 Tax=Alkalihalobacillus alcalophilus TaxID=1445 RepID=UPI001F3D8F75
KGNHSAAMMSKAIESEPQRESKRSNEAQSQQIKASKVIIEASNPIHAYPSNKKTHTTLFSTMSIM